MRWSRQLTLPAAAAEHAESTEGGGPTAERQQLFLRPSLRLRSAERFARARRTRHSSKDPALVTVRRRRRTGTWCRGRHPRAGGRVMSVRPRALPHLRKADMRKREPATLHRGAIVRRRIHPVEDRTIRRQVDENLRPDRDSGSLCGQFRTRATHNPWTRKFAPLPPGTSSKRCSPPPGLTWKSGSGPGASQSSCRLRKRSGAHMARSKREVVLGGARAR